jgi:DNA-binding HxlR family transcriptional regulator
LARQRTDISLENCHHSSPEREIPDAAALKARPSCRSTKQPAISLASIDGLDRRIGALQLDVLGDRWTLLVLRELLIQGPCRYTDLARGLPGIATSVLADRLRALEESGLLRREAAPPPIATTLFQLTEQGRAVEPILVTLGRWSIEHLDGPSADAEVQFHWFPWSASMYLHGHRAEGLPLVIQLVTPIGSGVVDVTIEGVRTRVGTATSPDLTITGMPDSIIKLLSGQASLAEAQSHSVTFDGDVGILAEFPDSVAA